MRYLVIPGYDIPATYKVKKSTTSKLGTYFQLGYDNIHPLNDKQQLIKFNPSLTLLRENKNSSTYLMVYRAVYPAHPLPDNQTVMMPRQPPYKTSMWDTKWNSIWGGSGAAIVRISRDGSINVTNDKILPKDFSYVEDARIYKHRGQLQVHFTTYTYWQEFKNAGQELTDCPDRKGGLCIIQMTQGVKQTGTSIKTIGKPTVLCRNVHERFEKNWCFVPSDPRRRLFQYGLFPRLRFLESPNDAPHNLNNCKIIEPPRSDFFLKLWNYYKRFYPMKYFKGGVSGTTPLFDYHKDYYLGVGHMKVVYTKMPLSQIRGSNKKLFVFMRELVDLLGLKEVPTGKWPIMSPYVNPAAPYIYLSFFYTINKKDLSLRRFSPAFLPQNRNLPYIQTVTFPMTIEKFGGDNIVVSQGVGDINCGFMIFSRSEIGKLLKYNNGTNPEEFEYKMLYPELRPFIKQGSMPKRKFAEQVRNTTQGVIRKTPQKKTSV